MVARTLTIGRHTKELHARRSHTTRARVVQIGRTQASSSQDGDISVHPRLNGDGGDLLNLVGRGVEIHEALVDAQLVPIPRVGSCTR